MTFHLWWFLLGIYRLFIQNFVLQIHLKQIGIFGLNFAGEVLYEYYGTGATVGKTANIFLSIYKMIINASIQSEGWVATPFIPLFSHINLLSNDTHVINLHIMRKAMKHHLGLEKYTKLQNVQFFGMNSKTLKIPQYLTAHRQKT